MQSVPARGCVFFSHTLEEKQDRVTPACGRCSSPPLFAVAAVKTSLSLRCEVLQQEVKCFGLRPICLWAVCKNWAPKEFPGAGAVIADVALCQLWWEPVVASVRGSVLSRPGWWSGTDELAACCEQWSVTYPCLLMCEAMSQALSTPSAHTLLFWIIWTRQEKAMLLAVHFLNKTPAFTTVIKLCIVMQ